MPARFIDLPVAAATACAQLQTALAVELSRDVSHLHGSFSTKQVKGSRQWYFSFREPDQRVRQIYVDPDNEEVRSRVDRAHEPGPMQQLRPLARAAVALGCTPTQRKHISVILRLSEHGFFRAGDVLVGTHASSGVRQSIGRALDGLGADG